MTVGENESWEVVVVGAGAAGLLAAARAAELGKRVLLLEKNRKPGAKILMSGGTRCNITQNTDRRGIVTAFGKPGQFLHSALAALGPKEVVALFEAEGVATKVEETGKVFPASNKAADVLGALLDRLGRSGAELAIEEPVENITRLGEGFEVTTPQRTVHAEKLLITTGGQSYPGCGTTGDGYAWLAAVGHTIVPPRPSLTPITTGVAWVAELSGVTVPDVGVRVVELPPENPHGKAKVLAEDRGSFLFTHFGLSGPAILNVSRAVTAHEVPQSLFLECNFLPQIKPQQLETEFQRAAERDGKRPVLALVPGDLPRRLVESLAAQLDLTETKAGEFSKAARAKFITALTAQRIAIGGTRGFKKAEVTAGGVLLGEVDSSTMQSKLVPNLYLAGEILDLDGPIGGYNFQAAFSGAWLAAESM